MKWTFARWFQFVAYTSILIAGLAYRFGFQTIPELLQHIPTDIYIPIASEWIGRVAETYRYRGGLTGLEHLLMFSWLLTLSALAVSLIVVLPELLRSPLTMGNNLDKAVLVYRTLHQRLYHRWYCPPYVKKEVAKKLRETQANWRPKHPCGKSLAELYVENIRPSYLHTHIWTSLAAFLSFCFFSSAGPIGSYPPDVYVGEPVFIALVGIIFEETLIYLSALLIVFVKTKMKRG